MFLLLSIRLFIDLFDLVDPTTFDRNQVPKCFWITSGDDSDEVRKEEALAYAKYKKLGGIQQQIHHVFDKPPSTPQAFPNRKATCEGGYGSRKIATMIRRIRKTWSVDRRNPRGSKTTLHLLEIRDSTLFLVMDRSLKAVGRQRPLVVWCVPHLESKSFW